MDLLTKLLSHLLSNLLDDGWPIQTLDDMHDPRGFKITYVLCKRSQTNESGSLRTYARGHGHFCLVSCPRSSTIILSMSACA
jgi:hypothetical protein